MTDETKKSKEPSKVAVFFSASGETLKGIQEGLTSKDGPTRRMSLLFLFCALGIFCTAGFWVKYVIVKKHEQQEVAILAQFVGEDKTKSHEDPKFLLHGWITRKAFMKYFYRYDFGYGERLIVDAPLLDPLSELLEEYAITTG